MNILILSWRDPKHPLAGGAEQVVLEHAKGWIEAGNDVTWFSSRFNNSSSGEVISGLKIIRHGYQYLGVQISAFFYYFHHRRRFDIVIDQFHGIPFFTPLYVKKPKLALIQEVAGKVWLLNPLPFPMNLIVGIIGLIFEPFVFLLYKNTPFMTGSESAKREVAKFGIPLSNITVVPHGVVLPKIKTKHINSKIPTITYLGILSKDKGIEDILNCFKELNKMGKYRFWIVGRPETNAYYRKIKELVDKFRLNEKIKFWGYVSQDKKYELLSKSAILVNSSIHEGWGLVNIEANIVGTPVVSYNSSGLVDSVVNGVSGIVVKVNTPTDMAVTIKKILEDKNMYNKLSSGAKKWSENFNWSKSRQLSLDLINSLV